MAVPQAFLDRVADPSPALRVKTWPGAREKPLTVKVEHRLGSRPTRQARQNLDTLRGHDSLRELLQFYKKHDGVQFCRTYDSLHDEIRPLVELKPVESIRAFTGRQRGQLGDVSD